MLTLSSSGLVAKISSDEGLKITLFLSAAEKQVNKHSTQTARNSHASTKVYWDRIRPFSKEEFV